jgi:hypothetical protein
MVDASAYSSIGHPTSATRMHQAANWPPPPPWAPDGAHPIAYHQVPGAPAFYPAYYRPPPGMMPAGPPHQPQINPELVGQPHPVPSGPSLGQSSEQGQNASPSAVVDPSLSENGGQNTDKSSKPTSQEKKQQAAPVIDPSLDSGTRGGASEQNAPSPEHPPVSMDITHAAMVAVLDAARRQAEEMEANKNMAAGDQPATTSSEQIKKSGAEKKPASTPEQSKVVADAGKELDGDTKMNDAEATDRPSEKETGQSGAAEKQAADPSHAQMLTEDGEPMLNPCKPQTVYPFGSAPADTLFSGFADSGLPLVH